MSGANDEDPPQLPAQPPKRKVGYGSPPVEHQFPPGRSGSPKGRPQRAKGFRSEVREVLATPVKTSGGKRVSCRKGILMNQAAKALRGDTRAQKDILTRAAILDLEDDARAAANSNEEIDERDKQLIEAALQRLKPTPP